MSKRFAVTAILMASLCVSRALTAQLDSATVLVRGTVTGKGGRALSGVLVVDAATLDGIRTDSLGRFRLRVSANADSVLLAARAIGYAPFQRALRRSDTTTDIGIALEPLAPQLSAITVAASTYTASTDRTATLTPLQVATTPGANADVYRAIQTLPGVQLSDEGNGLTTRGGDVTETRAFVDGAPLFNPVETVTPAGSIAATINPFLLDRITFSSGGFDAAYGNTLSGIVDLRSQARPTASFVNGNLSMAGAALSAGVALPHRLGLSATISRNTIAPITAVNGNPRAFDPVPNGGTLSGNVGWGYRSGGVLKLFALRQTNRLGVTLDDPAGDFVFRSARQTHVAVVSLNDSSERVTLFANASSSGLARNEDFGTIALATTFRSLQSIVRGEWRPVSRVQLRSGGELERLSAEFQRRGIALPPRESSAIGLHRTETRTAVFGELSIALRDSLRLTLGTRREGSGFATRSVIDPRASLAWMPSPHFALTAAWGWYSQLADPTYIDRGANRNATLPFQRAMHTILGAQFTQRSALMRAELWQKRWRELVQLDRNFRPVAAGRGSARGADLFLRAQTPFTSEIRVTYSLIHARRTDPSSGQIAPSPSDITHTATIILDSRFRQVYTVNVAWRYATGRPFTDITGATDIGNGVFAPIYAAPFAERLSPIIRTDAAVSRLLNVGANRFAVAYAGLGNLFGRRNVQTVTWSRDYSERLMIRSVFNRSIFVGCNLSITAPTR
jgi:vitamin B12 transporter